MRAWFDQIEIFSQYYNLLTFTYIFTFLKFLICIHAGASRVPPRVLAKTLRGQLPIDTRDFENPQITLA